MSPTQGGGTLRSSAGYGVDVDSTHHRAMTHPITQLRLPGTALAKARQHMRSLRGSVLTYWYATLEDPEAVTLEAAIVVRQCLGRGRLRYGTVRALPSDSDSGSPRPSHHWARADPKLRDPFAGPPAGDAAKDRQAVPFLGGRHQSHRVGHGVPGGAARPRPCHHLCKHHH